MTTFLEDRDIEAIGDTLGQNFTEGQLNALCDLLRHAGEACAYAAEDLTERADFGGEQEGEYTEEADGFSETSGRLGQLIESIELGERRYREGN